MTRVSRSDAGRCAVGMLTEGLIVSGARLVGLNLEEVAVVNDKHKGAKKKKNYTCPHVEYKRLLSDVNKKMI